MADAQSPEIRLCLPNDTGRIQLIHPPPSSDDPAFHKMAIHPNTLKYLPLYSADQTVEDARARREARVADSTRRTFHIHLRTPLDSKQESFVGGMGFLHISAENASSMVGFALHPNYHRAGYASEALFLLLDYGFAPKPEGGMGFNRISFETASLNIPTREFLKSAGAKEEGVLREAWKVGDKFVDSVGLSILRREWDDEGARDRLLKRVEAAILKGRLGIAALPLA